MAKNPVRHQGFALLLLLAGAAALPAAAQTTRWTRQFGSAQMDQANGVAVAPSGVYVIGTTSPGGQGIPVNSDVIVRKYNFDGLLLWSDQFGTPNTDEGLAVAANASGVYFAGMIGGTTAQAEGFLRKYDASGNLLWTRQFGGANEIVAAKAVAADSSAVYVAGSATGANSGFLRKYDLNGNLIWEIASSSGSIPGVTGLASDGSYLYLSGPPAPLLPGQSEAGTFVRKYDANGNAVWTRQFGASSNARVNAIATDGSNLYMAGTVSGILPGQSGAGGSDAFVRKYDADGNELWTRQFGSASLDEGFGVSADPTGVYIAGQAGGTLPGQQSGGG
ncbi:MAG TPA: hypothetical protein VNN17_11700, partial [Terriglobia bacterium]|nr:hypothetical protein [Terriglobia bacterium]